MQYLAPAGSFIIQNLRAQWTADTSVLATNVKCKSAAAGPHQNFLFQNISKLYLRQLLIGGDIKAVLVVGKSMCSGDFIQHLFKKLMNVL